MRRGDFAPDACRNRSHDHPHDCLADLRAAAAGDATALVAAIERGDDDVTAAVLFALAPRIRIGRAEIAELLRADERAVEARPSALFWRALDDRDAYRMLDQPEAAARAPAIAMGHDEVLADPDRAIAILVAEQVARGDAGLGRLDRDDG